ncbi:MAG: hypothetical protein N2482_02555, partial [Patescibacteria group bacterium]|nr:hypothetical protein [Patescibacteria group bacterium]
MIITSFFKKILLFIVSAIFLIWPFFVSAEEPLWPQEDFDLVYPVYRMYTPDDPAPIDKDYKILFAFYPAAVRDGKLSNVSDGNYRTNISYRLGAQTFTGDGIIKLEGVYDKETGKISGNYKIDKSVSNTDKRGGGGWYRGTESGTFQGQVIKDHVVLNFFCKKNNGEWYYKFPNYKSSTGIEEKSGTETRCTYIVNKVSYMVVSIAKPQSAVSKLTDVESPKKHVDAGVRVAGMTGQVDIEIDGVRRPLKMDDVIPVSYTHL